MKYKFYGSNEKEIYPINEEYAKIKNQFDLYDKLSEIWYEYSCAPRLRDKWSTQNKTLGQCSITAFLVQDIFGGEVYGVPLDDGGYHCYNVVNDVKFDLTSEQFPNELTYDDLNLQSREEHFLDRDKENRYNYLKSELKKVIDKIK